MVVLGGVAVSYERGTPVVHHQAVLFGQLLGPILGFRFTFSGLDACGVFGGALL